MNSYYKSIYLRIKPANELDSLEESVLCKLFEEEVVEALAGLSPIGNYVNVNINVNVNK
jgi:hypothetical protein